MNFLAHMLLSCEGEESMVGNFIADFISNRELDQYPEGVREGVWLHRRIDSFTDSHPLVRKSARRLYSDHSKYSTVIIDVFYDHLLAVNWEQYSEVPLSDFAGGVYAVLERHQPMMPPVLQHRLPMMIADNWLIRYENLESIGFTIDRMKRRASRPHLMDNAIESLERHYEALDKEFNDFFPDLQDFVTGLCRKAISLRSEGK